MHATQNNFDLAAGAGGEGSATYSMGNEFVGFRLYICMYIRRCLGSVYFVSHLTELSSSLKSSPQALYPDRGHPRRQVSPLLLVLDARDTPHQVLPSHALELCGCARAVGRGQR